LQLFVRCVMQEQLLPTVVLVLKKYLEDKEEINYGNYKGKTS